MRWMEILELYRETEILTSQNGETSPNTYRAKVIATLEAPLKSLKTNLKKIKIIYQ